MAVSRNLQKKLVTGTHTGTIRTAEEIPQRRIKTFMTATTFLSKTGMWLGEGKAEYKGYVCTPSGALKGYDGKTKMTYGL